MSNDLKQLLELIQYLVMYKGFNKNYICDILKHSVKHIDHNIKDLVQSLKFVKYC